MPEKSNKTSERDEKWVEIGTFQGPVFAEMAKDALEQNNIPCLLNKSFWNSAYGVSGTNMAGMSVKVMVPQENEVEGRDILSSLVDESEE